MFSCAYDPDAIEPLQRPRASLFGHHELRRMIGDIYRECPTLKKHREIAAEVIRRKGWETGNRALLVLVQERVRDSRKRMRQAAGR